ncbi:MAG: hypothetical protein ACREQ5_34725, partial [Candidatus Dormibacteria bacterium]
RRQQPLDPRHLTPLCRASLWVTRPHQHAQNLDLSSYLTDSDQDAAQAFDSPPVEPVIDCFKDVTESGSRLLISISRRRHRSPSRAW